MSIRVDNFKALTYNSTVGLLLFEALPGFLKDARRVFYLNP